MSDTDPRPTLTPPARPRPGSQFVPLLALGLVVALIAVALIQLRQTLPQHRTGLGLAAVAVTLALALAALGLRQWQQLQRQRKALADLDARMQRARREVEADSAGTSTLLAGAGAEMLVAFHRLQDRLSQLQESGLTPRQIDHLRSATDSAGQLLTAVNDAIDLLQLEGRVLTLVTSPVELRSMLRTVEALVRPQASARSMTLHIDADPGVPERIVADPRRLQQILSQLLSAAVASSGHGGVMLDVRPGGGEEGRPEIEFVITDTGPAIEESTPARLADGFDPNDRSDPQPGAALGAEISRRLACLMGGEISARSAPGAGLRLVVRLPLQAVPQPAAPDATGAQSGPASLRPAHALHVLVAEDHPVNRQYMAALLETLGHRAHFTTNGLEAVQAARERAFDVVLMDLYMPELDGVGATRAIRALPDLARSTVPIVALTADALEQTRERCLVAGMNDFLTKPVSPQKLATSLRRLFGSSAGVVPATAPPLVLPAAHDGNQILIDETAISMALQAMPLERLQALVAAFLDQGPQTVQRLRAAVRDAQPLELRATAHAARGAALNLGLAGLAATAQALHEGAAHLPAHEIARLVQRYEDLLTTTRIAVRSIGLGELPESLTR
jgi:hypothetical protein